MRSIGVILVLVTGSAAADPAPLGDCKAALTARKVAWKATSRPGIDNPVEIVGPLGGVAVTGDEPLVIDCSLAVSLDEAFRYVAALGIDHATVSSAYARRLVSGTTTPSKHSYGLAIDLPAFHGADGALRIDRDYQSGLGDEMDCVGAPSTKNAETLKVLQCQLVRSGLFHLVLSPDYDDGHRDHLHLEALPWHERTALRASTPAIH
jgi:hypothetical protein